MAESNSEKKFHGLVAEYTSVDTLLEACRRVRDAGYTKTDAYAPFPVHGIDTALGIKATVLPWIALGAGLSGTAVAFAMQIWMNGINYPYIISGKPFISLPAFVPVGFELTILFASFGAFFGMWALNGLPRFSNPIFTSPRFDRVTDDTFFLYIDAKDQRFDRAGVEQLLTDTGGTHIEAVVEDNTPSTIPRFLLIGIVTVIALSMIPLLIVAKMRVTKSPQPRFHIFLDMDLSPSKDAQQTTTLFSDFRSGRPDVPGTVARGAGFEDLDVLTGIDVELLTKLDSERASRLVALHGGAIPQSDVAVPPADNETVTESQSAETGDAAPAFTAPATTEPATDGEPAAAQPADTGNAAEPVVDTTPWLTKIPVEVAAETYERGREKFNIYCSVCHGMDGRGNGLVNQRAQRILATTWTPPSNINDPTLHRDKYPDGKLFSTISNGIRKMPGYAGQIKTQDRWAVVAYVRALQLSQNASLDQVPESDRSRIEARKTEVDAELAKAAAAEAKRQADAESKRQSEGEAATVPAA